MRKFFILAVAIFFCTSLFLLQGCLKDSYTRTYTYTYYKPVYKTVAEVRSNIKSNTAQSIGRPGKIFVKGQYIFLNEVDKGVHIIDNANPAQPRNIAFINIPGNMDIAVKENTLYADLYTDLIAIDISDPRNVVLKKIVEGVFPFRYYNANFTQNRTMVIESWEKIDTTVTEKVNLNSWAKQANVFLASTDSKSFSSSASPYGVGGSMARFTVVNERLYTVGTSDLQVFNISNTVDPVYSNKKNMTGTIETIYPFKDKLFIGSQEGMFVYNLTNPDNPSQAGQFLHVKSCDPVIADDEYAYVTLRSGTRCTGVNNELDILRLNNLTDPTMVKIYSMTNPHGLSKDGTTLFVCDGNDGLKIYNAANVSNLQLIKKIADIKTFDVIALNGTALVVAEDGLYQYDYTDLTNIRQLSKITIAK